MKSDDDLEETIRDVNKRKNAAPEGSAAHRFAVRELEACLSRNGAADPGGLRPVHEPSPR
jgi:hypothetical protein